MRCEVLELGEGAPEVLDERAEVAGAEELNEGAVVPKLVIEGLRRVCVHVPTPTDRPFAA
jgi:hypothetical protein